MSTRKPKYRTLKELLAHELVLQEDAKTSDLMRRLRHVKRDKILTKAELAAICKWKSPRAILLIEANDLAKVETITRKAFSSRSEKKRIEYLTQLKGVSLPMASAILTLVDPRRYGVIDIRVWQLLFAISAVKIKPKGLGFTFKNWYHFLCKLRYHAKELGVSVRTVERTLFQYHKKIQDGVLYDFK
jgi:hypothetical protein